MKTPASEFSSFLLRYAICIGAIVIAGSIYNYEGLKYVRSRGTGCSQGILILSTEDSHVCCTSESYWVCFAAFDRLERLMSSQWAFVLPLIPVMFNIFLENWLYCSKSNTSKLTGALARLGLYVCIILFRTFVLYLVPAAIQSFLGSSESKCWCSDFVSEKTCKMQFDFSDHIVLSIVQYILPNMLELYYILQQTSSIHNAVNHSVLNKKEDDLSKNVWYIVPIMICLFFIVVNLRLLLLTSMFFHTPLENLTALFISYLCGFVPLFSEYGTNIFLNMMITN